MKRIWRTAQNALVSAAANPRRSLPHPNGRRLSLLSCKRFAVTESPRRSHTDRIRPGTARQYYETADGRTIGLFTKVSPEEKKVIDQRMALLGTTNLWAYLRKMAVDGCIIQLDMSGKS